MAQLSLGIEYTAGKDGHRRFFGFRNILSLYYSPNGKDFIVNGTAYSHSVLVFELFGGELVDIGYSSYEEVINEVSSYKMWLEYSLASNLHIKR